MDEQSSPPRTVRELPDRDPEQFERGWDERPLHVALGAAFVAALVASAAWVGYGLHQPRVEYVDRVEWVDRIVKEPYEQLVEVPVLTPVPGPKVEVPVPGPTVYVSVPGPTIVKKIYVRAPRHCPTSAAPSIADAVNEYEALDHKERNFQCRKTL